MGSEKTKLVAVVARVLVFSILSYGFYVTLWDDIFDSTSPSAGNPKTANNKPIAEFYINISEIYAGDIVDFISRSYDPDEDSVQSHSWVVTQNSQIITSSDADWFFSWNFSAPGTYIVSLGVTDSQNLNSDISTMEIVVLEKTDVVVEPAPQLKYSQDFESDDLENLPKDWTSLSGAVLSYDSTQIYKGSHSLKVLSSGNQAQFGAVASIDLSGDIHGLLKGIETQTTVFLKSESKLKANLSIRAKNAAGQTILSIDQPPVPVTSSWSKLSASYNIPPECQILEVSIIVEGKGTVWIDNFEIDIIK